MFLFTKKSIALLTGGVLFLIACQQSGTSPAELVSLQRNQSARLSSDVTVRVDSIVDSRCPINAYCIWAGQADVALTLSKESATATTRLILGASTAAGKRTDSTTVSLASQTYIVILRNVTPYPGTGTQGQMQQAIVQVTKR